MQLLFYDNIFVGKMQAKYIDDHMLWGAAFAQKLKRFGKNNFKNINQKDQW